MCRRADPTVGIQSRVKCYACDYHDGASVNDHNGALANDNNSAVVSDYDARSASNLDGRAVNNHANTWCRTHGVQGQRCQMDNRCAVRRVRNRLPVVAL